MNTSWKTNLGAALKIMGIGLGGQGILSQAGTFGSTTENIIAIIGGVLFIAGEACTALFSANPVTIKAVTDSLQAQVVANANSIVTGDAAHSVAGQAAAAAKLPGTVPSPTPAKP